MPKEYIYKKMISLGIFCLHHVLKTVFIDILIDINTHLLRSVWPMEVQAFNGIAVLRSVPRSIRIGFVASLVSRNSLKTQ